VRERCDSPIARRIEAEIEFSVFTYRAHVPTQLFADLQRTSQLRVVEESPMRILHDGLVSQWSFSRDE
jgi:hypothetical protein